MRMIARIKKTLLLVIPIHILFQFSRIHDLGKYIELELSGASPDKKIDHDVLHI